MEEKKKSGVSALEWAVSKKNKSYSPESTNKQIIKTVILLFVLLSGLGTFSLGLAIYQGSGERSIQGEFFSSIIGIGAMGISGLLYFIVIKAIKKNLKYHKRSDLIIIFIMSISIIAILIFNMLMSSYKTDRIEFSTFNPTPQMVTNMNNEIYRQLDENQTVNLIVWFEPPYDFPQWTEESRDQYIINEFILVMGEQNVDRFLRQPGTKKLLVKTNREGFNKILKIDSVVSIQLNYGFLLDLLSS